MTLKDLYPQPLWQHFQALCDRPRPSKHEVQVIDYLRDFATRHRLSFVQDTIGNVVLSKAATVGWENSPCIAMQCHIDMVPQKRNDIQHDFYKDPIRPIVDGGWVRANGTTLGADNGIGVAAMLAILEAKDIEHGPLEALFTVDEEAGMSGAKGLDPRVMQASILFNLDSEDEGELYVGCAGGVDLTIHCGLAKQSVPNDWLALTIHISELRGGHSGIDIHLGRANANILLAELLLRLRATLDIAIQEMSGGTLRNAIPRDARATIFVAPSLFAEVQQCIDRYSATLRDRYHVLDPNIRIVAQAIENKGFDAYDAKTCDTLLKAIVSAPNGVLETNTGDPSIVEVSSNLAILKPTGQGIEVQCLLRSSDNEAKYRASRNVMAGFDALNPQVRVDGAYSGWKPNLASAVLATMRDIYQENFNQIAEVKVIHAGLECGILGGIYPHWDMISFGPTIRGAHSPDECVDIDSVGRFWQFLCIALREVARS